MAVIALQQSRIEATAIAALIWYIKKPAPVAALPSEGRRRVQEPFFRVLVTDAIGVTGESVAHIDSYVEWNNELIRLVSIEFSASSHFYG